MANKFTELRTRMSPESRARSEAKAQVMLAEMPLNELRQARGLTQKMLAEMLHVQLTWYEINGHIFKSGVYCP